MADDVPLKGSSLPSSCSFYLTDLEKKKAKVTSLQLPLKSAVVVGIQRRRTAAWMTPDISWTF